MACGWAGVGTEFTASAGMDLLVLKNRPESTVHKHLSTSSS